MLLYVNACVREGSRTDRLARVLLSRLGDYTERRLKDEKGLLPLDEPALRKREWLCRERNFSDPHFRYAKEFSEADEIVIAAPLWDFSFPAILKIYLENVYAIGVVSRYGEDGVPVGLCRAKRLWFVSTAGGSYDPVYGFEYIKRLATVCFGIPECKLIFAEGLDIIGADPEKILAERIGRLSLEIQDAAERKE